MIRPICRVPKEGAPSRLHPLGPFPLTSIRDFRISRCGVTESKRPPGKRPLDLFVYPAFWSVNDGVEKEVPSPILLPAGDGGNDLNTIKRRKMRLMVRRFVSEQRGLECLGSHQSQ